MVSIFKVIRDNDIHLLNYLIDSSTGDQRHKTYQISKQAIQSIEQQIKLSGSRYYDINKRSVYGRTALHCVVTWNRIEMAQALIDCPAVNVNLSDRENGWTALHRALYMGNIEIARLLLARDDIDFSIKDWEGFTAFDLYNSTIADTFPKEQIHYNKIRDEPEFEHDRHWQLQHMDNTHQDEPGIGKGGTDVYTWGYNTNYVLGHADSENRIKPERVNLQLSSQQSPNIIKRPSYSIETVQMSKYHMAILTSEPQQNLLVCGFGRGGRLGTGKELDTKFTPIPVQWPERIMSVALGRDHTIAVTVNGNVITFGQNNFGQLGYDTNTHGKEESPMQLVPRKIQAQSLKKQPILGAAASRVHSVVYTSTDIFTFGYNQGQLGYHQPDNEFCQITPRKVSVSTKILQVVANDNATVILNTSHEIILLCNYSQQRLFLPVQKFPSNIQVHRSEENFAVKLVTSGTEYLGAVTNAGDVFIWTCRSPHVRQLEQQNINKKLISNSSTSGRQAATIVSTPKRIWTAQRPHLAAVDASIGQHGEILVCTISGHVFIGRPEANGYKFNPVPSIQRCIQVCANSSGAFAAIRSEFQLQPITEFPLSTLVEDMKISLPHIQATNWLIKQLQSVEANESLEIAAVAKKYTKYNRKQIGEDDKQDFESEKSAINRKFLDIKAKRVKKAWKRSELLAQNDKALDIILVVDEKNIYCHSTILRCRSEIFKRLIKGQDRLVSGDMQIKLKKRESDGRIEIYIDRCQISSILLLLDYVYTDTYQHPMGLNFQLPLLCSTQNLTASFAKSIQKDLLTLARIFHIPHLIDSAQENYYRQSYSLQKDFNRLLEKGKGTDVVIVTEGSNKGIHCHDIILRQRCSFFQNILKPGSVWMENRSIKDQGIEINLDQISTEIMQTIIRYIYVDEDEGNLFNEIEKDREEAMMYFLLGLLREADFLLLARLKSITESALVRFIELRSAAVIFEYADLYLADALKEKALHFISVNLPTILGSSMLDDLSVKLIRDLQQYVQQCQIKENTTVPRGEIYNFVADETFLEVEDPEFSNSLYAASRGDGEPSYVETLVTLRHEKRVKVHQNLTLVKNDSDNDVSQDTCMADPASLHKNDTSNSGKLKKGVKGSIDKLENELHLLENQPRRVSPGWATTSNDDTGESSSKPSLREIIQTEDQRTDLQPKIVKKSVPKKVSQKERRRLMHKQELEAVTELSTSSGKPVWGKVPEVEIQPIAKVTPEIKDHSNASSGSDRKGKKIYVPETLLDEFEEENSRPTQQDLKKTLYNPIESFGPSFSLTPIRRVHPDSNGKSASVSKKSFDSIQKQQQLEDNWLKDLRPKKNILKIQKEEQAIESIAQYYLQTLDIMSGEWLEVSRVFAR